LRRLVLQLLYQTRELSGHSRRRVGPCGPQQFTVVLNWQAGLKK